MYPSFRALLVRCRYAHPFMLFQWSSIFLQLSGATNQILLFAMLAVKVKQNAPGCHTYLEVVNVSSLLRLRYRKSDSFTSGSVWQTCPYRVLVFRLCYKYSRGVPVVTGRKCSRKCSNRHECLRSCDINTPGVNVQAQLIYSNWLTAMSYLASQSMSSLEVSERHSCECMHPRTCCITKHLSRCDYSHTLILWICALFFAFKVYSTSPKIGSPTEMWNLLNEASKTRPVVGNKDGSYLTMKSNC